MKTESFDELKKGDILISLKGSEAKVIDIKSDDYYSGDMVHIRMEFLSGLNTGAKVWYDKKTLMEVFTMEAKK